MQMSSRSRLYKFGRHRHPRPCAFARRSISPRSSAVRRSTNAPCLGFGGSAAMDKRRSYTVGRLLASPAGFGGGGDGDLPDLSEDDVWPAFPDDHPSAEIDDGYHRWTRTDRGGERRWADQHVGGLSLAFEEAYRGTAAPPRREKRIIAAAAASSAPVDVPAWPRHLRGGSGGPPPDPEVEEDSSETEWLPPHEYLARAHGRSAATSSVLVGAGRTLKGRDMSRVRDAVWSQTGFFG